MNPARWAAEFKAGQFPGSHLPWLHTLRQQAMARFVAEGWPTSRQEQWRHTSLALLDQQDFSAAATAPDYATMVAAYRQQEAGHWLVFVDGHYAATLSQLGLLPAGAHIGSLEEALQQQPEAVAAVFGTVEDGHSPSALNAALFRDGAFIHLARGVAVAQPIHLLFLGGSKASQHLRNLIIAEAGARATIIEHYLGHSDSSTLTTTVTRIEAAQDAHLTHVKLQQEAEQTFHLGALNATQQRGATLDSHSLSFGARLARHDIRTQFAGTGCNTLFNGLYHVDSRRHVDHHTHIEHAQPQGNSREYYRGIIDGTARGVFAGRILVAPQAQRSDAIQRCDHLLLSRLAEADARPELEIYADDVKCAHGATVGQIDDEALFYLRSRGLDESEARQRLTYAFAVQALQRISFIPLRQRARAALLARLPGGNRMEEEELP